MTTLIKIIVTTILSTLLSSCYLDMGDLENDQVLKKEHRISGYLEIEMC